MSSNENWTLYLDFDGVLNNDPFLRHQRNVVPPEDHALFDPANILAANHLCDELPVAQIVVTSSWREGRTIQQLRDLLAGEAFCRSDLVAAVTASTGDRVEEIEAHIVLNSVRNHLVLDDMNLHPMAPPVFFRTSGATGLTMQQAAEILARLR